MVVVLRLSVDWGRRVLVRWHRVLGRSLLSVKVLNTLVLLLSVLGQLTSDLVFLVLDLFVHLLINILVDEIHDLSICNLGVVRLGLGRWLWHWGHRRLVVDRLRLRWDHLRGLVNWHHRLLVFNDWHREFCGLQLRWWQFLWFLYNFVVILFVS